ncbi:kynurenine formamidase-like isoform X2 [Euwallacea fornicatus]|uniref:kynurenine formamidase-like isoform X2 n=1 Tax=Euwallacea fornicatus TaxID=995702 RepID=UPI00338EC1A4
MHLKVVLLSALMWFSDIFADVVFDLTWNFSNDTIYWIKSRPFELTKRNYVVGDEYAYSANEFCAAEHGGTHFDAPYHFFQQGLKVSEVDVSKLYTKGALIDLTIESQQLGRNSRLRVKHLENWEATNGPFENGTVLLVKFGRSKYWTNRSLYLDLEEETLNFPGFSNEAAKWIVDSGKFYGVGLDTPSVDPGNTTDFYVHQLLARNSLYILENVKLLEDLPEKGFTLIVAPMKIQDGTGAPLRLFAVLPDTK